MFKLFIVLITVFIVIIAGEFVMLRKLQKQAVVEKNASEERGCEFQGKTYQHKEGFYLELNNGCSGCVCWNGEISCREGCP